MDVLQPHFERVARLFTGPNRVHEGVVYFAKVDCADQVIAPLCVHCLKKTFHQAN